MYGGIIVNPADTRNTNKVYDFEKGLAQVYQQAGCYKIV